MYSFHRRKSPKSSLGGTYADPKPRTSPVACGSGFVRHGNGSAACGRGQFGKCKIEAGGYELSTALPRPVGFIFPVLSQVLAERICSLKCCQPSFCGEPPQKPAVRFPGPERYSQSDPTAHSRPPILSRWYRKPPSRASLALRSLHSSLPEIKPSNFRVADIFLPLSLTAVKSNRAGCIERDHAPKRARLVTNRCIL